MTYKEFIENILLSRNRFVYDDQYTERHHILPKCCGGDDSCNNLIDLFAAEHYEAHKLLALEHPDNDKLQFAWWQMCHCKKADRAYEVSVDEYAMAKEAHSCSIAKQMTALWADPESREKREATLSCDVTRKKMSDSAKRRYATPEGRAHIEGIWTDERKARISKSVIQFTKDGDYVADFFGAHEASRRTGIVSSSIIECCGGKRKSAGGYIWKYKE